MEGEEEGVEIVEEIVEIMWQVLHEAAEDTMEGASQSVLTGDKHRLTTLLPKVDNNLITKLYKIV